MNHVFFIVDGNRDIQILSYIIESIFPKDNKRFHYYIAYGFSGIISSIRPILDLVSDDSKVIVVFDADTINPSKVQEKIDFVNIQIENGVVDNRLLIIPFVPTIEGELQLDKSFPSIRSYLDKNKKFILENVTIKRIINFINS